MRFRPCRSAAFPLRSRLAVTVGLLVLAATLLVGPLAMRLAERDMREVIGGQEVALLTSAAAFVDDRLQDRLAHMQALAEAVPAPARADPRRLQAWLSERGFGQDEFVNVVAFARSGELVATGSSMPSAQLLTASGRPYFEDTLRAGRGIVSDPVVSRLSGAQVVVVTAPVFGADGRIAYVLAGRIDLEHSGFLRQIAALRPGRTGYLYLMSSRGLVIDHPSRERLLQRADALPGARAGTARALKGFEGWLYEPGPDGGAIVAYKRLRTAGWILAARYPDQEAFAPLAVLGRQVLAAAAGLGLLAGLLAWWIIRVQLAPLERLRRGAAAILHEGADIGVLRTSGRDEIGELGRAFHELVRERERAMAQMRAIADNVPAVIAYVDREERCRFTNAGFDRMLGLAPGAALGRPLREALGEAGYARFRPQIHAALDGEHCHFEDARSDDARRHQMIDCIPDIGADGRVAGFYVLAMDISERKEAELRQAASEKRLRLIADNLPVLICYIDRGHRLGFGNATFRSWLGLDPARLSGTHLAQALGDPAYDSVRPRLKQAFGGSGVRFEMTLVAQGRSRILEWTFVPDVQSEGRTVGEVAGVYALAHDMTRVKEAESQLVRMARFDALTGIANRRLFTETLGRALERARRQASVLGLAYLDIDFFKRINDTWGHGVGDEVLKEFARRLQDCVRASDTPARMAGDEFVILFEPVASRADAEAIGAKVVQAMRQPFATTAGALAVTASVGITLADAGAGKLPSEDELLVLADRALYAAKQGGRDRCVVLDGTAAAPAGATAQNPPG